MIVRRLEKCDLQLRVDWMNNPKVYSTMHFSIPVLLENTYKWFEGNTGNPNRADLAFEDEGVIVAFGGLTGINRETNKAELYVFVDPNSQKTGIGTQATKLLCRYGFEELGLEKIYLETNEDNYVARKVYENCGFILEGKLRNEYKTADGILMCRMYYGLLKGELND